MTENPTILEQLQKLSGLFLTIDEIVILLDIDKNLLVKQIKEKRGDLYTAWFLGKTLSKKEIHENIVKMAKKGSPAAEETASKMLVNMELDSRDSCL